MDKRRLEELSSPLVKIYQEIQEEILINIAKRMGKGDLENIQAWEQGKLELIHNYNEENAVIIAQKLGITLRELQELLRQAGFEGAEPNELLFEAAIKAGADLKKPPPLKEDEVIIDILKNYEKQARDVFNLTNSSLLQHSEQVYRDIINKTVADTLAGTKTAHVALRDTIRQWSHQGIPALIDKAGKQWSAEGYVRMVTRAMGNRITNDMQEARMDSWGQDLVEISSHVGARPKCAPYQGKIYSRKGASNRFPSLSSTSKGEPDGLFGINCGHRQYPYFPGTSKKRYEQVPDKKNERAYENSQKQRRIEREIRNAKTELRVMKELGDEEGIKIASTRIRAKQAKMREFIKGTGRTRRYDREQIY